MQAGEWAGHFAPRSKDELADIRGVLARISPPGNEAS